MKLTSLIILSCMLQVSAATFAQKVTLKETQASLKTVFNQISNQTGYDFVITSNLLGQAKPVTINVKDTELNDVLAKIFSDQPLSFTIQEKTVVVSEKKTSLPDEVKKKSNVTLPLVTIAGKVVDEKGNPLPGVSIRAKGSTKAGTATNQNGIFVATVENNEVIVQFSFVGFVTREIPASQLNSTTPIVMKEDISKLDEIQVIAYGTTTKRNNTGDITTIDDKTIEKYPTTNVLDVLQGTVPGMAIYKNTGNVTSTYKVQIRGINGYQTMAAARYM